MTDNEIIKALECCINDACEDCPLYGENAPDVYGNCVQNTKRNALDLINRQKAEIERLQEQYKFLENNSLIFKGGIDYFKAEAIKEFAERLKNKSESCTDWGDDFVLCEDIDDLVKEMAGDTE